ncbi:MAG TPA: HAMP domain-containing sensor histidine kinase [Longimicrobium sp.]|nr:HAMP domain-containing sensor histidine kinase [Longimicrobium sp.]
MRGFSLRAKVFVLFAGAALLIVVPTLLLIASAVKRKVYADATRELALADSSLQNAWALRGDALVQRAEVKKFTLAEVESWTPRGAGVLARQLRAPDDDDKGILLAADSAFRLLAGSVRVDSAALRAAAAVPGTSVVLPDSGPPVRIAVAEVWRTVPPPEGDSTASDTLVRVGAVGVGSRISAGSLQKENALTSELVVLVGDSIVGSTLPPRAVSPAEQAAAVRGYRENAPGRPQPLALGGQTYFARRARLDAAGPPVTVLMFRPIREELQIAQGIARSLFGIGFAALALALLLAAVVARIVARPAQALAQASKRMAQGDFEAPLPRPSGDEIGQLARAFGEMRRAIGEREARLRSAQAEMIHREKLAAMGRLVAQLSHEINNPIYNIQNCLEALERRGDPEDPNREFLTLAQEELRRMASLTRRLLDQSRPQSDASSLLDLNRLAARVLTLAAPELEARGVRVRSSLAPDLPRVVAHPEAIHEVLANLVANARDAMPEGGELRVATRADGEAVEVVVEDTGAGISEKDLPHIFEAFYTTKPGVTGIGLGLFVSEGIIRGHRGRIDVQSAPGQGSRFTVRLPRETLDEALSDAAEGEAAEPAAAAD